MLKKNLHNHLRVFAPKSVLLIFWETPKSPAPVANMFAPGIHAQLHCNSVLEMLLVKSLVIWTSMCCTCICILAVLSKHTVYHLPLKDVECKPKDLDIDKYRM